MHLSSDNPVKVSGYLSLKEYVSRLESFTVRTGWKAPFHSMDKIQILFLKAVIRWSWFADSLYIQNPAQYGIGFDQLFNYINQNLFTIGLRRQPSSLQTIVNYHWRFFHKKVDGTIEPFALGTDFDHDVALSKAFGEGIERYFTLLSKPHTIRTAMMAAPAQLQQKKTAYYFPPLHHQYTEVQQSAHPFLYQGKDQEIEWVVGEKVGSAEPVYIPKQLTSRVCQKVLIPREGLLSEVNTSGGAGWFTKDGAVYRGLFEIIQRDAFMVAWLRKHTLPAIDLATIPDAATQGIVTQLKAAQAELLLLKAEAVAGVPTVIAIVIDRGLAEEQVYVTAHSDTTMARAMLGSLHEALTFFTEKNPTSMPEQYKPFVTAGITRTERINLYRGEAWSARVRALHSGVFISYEQSVVGEFASVGDSEVLKELSSRLRAIGQDYEPIFYAYTHKVLKKIGFHVVKCFIPALFPLYLSEHTAPIKSTRLGTYTYVTHEEVIRSLNQTPHPFP